MERTRQPYLGNDRKACADKSPCSSAPWQACGTVYASAAASDARSRLSKYVQISDFVTKVLIRKRFRRLAFKRQLTNLET